MGDEGKELAPEQILKRAIWRATMSVGSALEQSTTWTLTGVAAIVALFISNLDAVSKIVTAGGVRISMILFAASILTGAISKITGMALQSGLGTITEMEKLLSSAAGTELMDAMTLEPRQLARELGEPFVWPLSRLMKRAGARGVTDYLSSDKRFVKLFCWQIYFNVFHALLAVAAIATLCMRDA
jgi:hypothetical protein